MGQPPFMDTRRSHESRWIEDHMERRDPTGKRPLEERLDEADGRGDGCERRNRYPAWSGSEGRIQSRFREWRDSRRWEDRTRPVGRAAGRLIRRSTTILVNKQETVCLRSVY